MKTLPRITLVLALAASSIAIGDAITFAASGHSLVDDQSPRLWFSLTDAVHAATYSLIVVTLVRSASAIDRGSGLRRWSRRLLAATFTVLAAVFATSTVIGRYTDLMEAIAGAAFLAMFAVGAFLGLLLLRGRLKVAACLMVAPLVLVPLAVMLNFAAPRLAHPAYAETALYIGLALLGALADQPATGEQQASSLIGRDTVKPSQT